MHADRIEAAAAASQTDWPPTRAAGLARLAGFTPAMGGVYAKRRNFDLGPERRDNVSLLSPYVRRRLVSEAECVRAALGAHGAGKAEKFVQEVFWRSYWKGWLQMRPSVWRAFVDERAAERDRAAGNAGLGNALAEAEQGRTGIDCFDDWARELVATGYLHNHARMWFASIWIFTLGLPWRLGADFFLRHLLDGDPASNTLGWRWVAGLHTRGKAYAAQAWNIDKFTQGRFEIAPRDLNETPVPLDEADALPPPAPLPAAEVPDADAPTALLITEEDCHPECARAGADRFAAVATLQITAARSDAPVSKAVADFDRGALEDAATRVEAAGGPTPERLADVLPADLVRWARRSGARQVVTAWPPTGPVRDWLDGARPALAAQGVRLVCPRRRWDEVVWPHATAGFFKVKQKIPKLTATLIDQPAGR